MAYPRCDPEKNLCGIPDIPNNTPREEAEKMVIYCRCCRAQMKVKDCDSEGLNQLGAYWVECDICESKTEKGAA